MRLIFNHPEHKKSLYSSALSGKGFSLLELIVGLAVASVTMLAVVSVFTTLAKSYTTQSASSSVQQVVRAGVDYMAQNIRMAGLNPKKNDDFEIVSATPTSIEFTLDRNLNGVKDDEAAEHMAYSYDAEKNEVDEAKDGGSGYRFIENVMDLTFTYFDELGNDLGDEPDPAEIRTVEIELTVAQAAGRGRVVDRTYLTRVICRNLGL